MQMINKDSDSTQRRHIIQSDRNGFYFNMEREGAAGSPEIFPWENRMLCRRFPSGESEGRKRWK